MTITADQLLLFVGTLAVAILSPGPGVIAVSQGAFALGRRRALPYAWGLALGASVAPTSIVQFRFARSLRR